MKAITVHKKITIITSILCVGVLVVFFLIVLCVRPVRSLWSLLGFDHKKEYIVLFQNNMELRPTGGFMGSYGRIAVEKGVVSLQKIEDIYVPDGQLDGHTTPPWPIQAAFGQGWFKLRDSNWDPDFTRSASTIAWFFEHGKEPKADGLIAVNLTLLRELLNVTGSLQLPDESEAVTIDNFYQKTQSAVETDFFPGSIQKQTFLSKLGRALMREVEHMSFSQKMRLVKVAWQLAKEKHIVVSITDARVQEMIAQIGFDGSLRDIRNKNVDYLSFFEANLGTNKANCCIKRDARLELTSVNDIRRHDLTISYTNTNPSTLKQPPKFWGGAYVNFLRVIIPIDATIERIQVGDKELPVVNTVANDSVTIEDLMINEGEQVILGVDADHQAVEIEKRDDKGLQIVGFFVFVDALSSMNVHLTYVTPQYRSDDLVIQKQGGIDGYDMTITTGQTSQKFYVLQDKTVSIKQ